MFTHAEYCDLAGEEITRFAGLVRDADPSLRVPSCPRWRLGDLVHHVGAIHRWAEGLVATLATKNRPRDETDDWNPRRDAAAQADWILAHRDRLIDTLRAADPDARMYAWGADQHVRFWSRRMTHETGIHRADAELALGAEPRFDAAVAADGVDEFLDNLWRARAWRWNIGKLRGDGEAIRLVSTDTTEEWIIRLEPKRPVWSRHEAGEVAAPAEVTVAAMASDLYLLMWARRPCADSRYQVTGDRELLARWQRDSAV